MGIKGIFWGDRTAVMVSRHCRAAFCWRGFYGVTGSKVGRRSGSSSPTPFLGLVLRSDQTQEFYLEKFQEWTLDNICGQSFDQENQRFCEKHSRIKCIYSIYYKTL